MSATVLGAEVTKMHKTQTLTQKYDGYFLFWVLVKIYKHLTVCILKIWVAFSVRYSLIERCLFLLFVLFLSLIFKD